MRLSKSARILKRGICLLMAVLMLSGVISVIPSSKVEAAGVEQGIDVSKYQGAINWAAVAQSGVTFAFIKVGSLKSGIDPYFYYNMQAAQAYGIKTGVYIYSYATSVEDVAVEAQFVLAALQNVSVSYPVAWDIEDDVQKNLSPDTLALMANTFCALIEAEGYYPMVYANKYWFTSKLGTIYYDKWAAQWNTSQCEVPGFSIWQYSCTGNIAGISGSVDLNYSFKDYSTDIVNTGWVARKGFMYFYINYKMQKGWLDLGAAKYYLDAYGRMVTGWLPLEDGIYFMQATGEMSTGLTAIGTGLYYFDTTGKMQTGLQNIGGLTYYFAADGPMYTGFLDLADGRRFFTTDGHMVTGLTAIADKLYYFDANGIMQTGYQNIGGLTYLFNADGSMYIGWFNDGVNTKYFDTDGHMAVGLVTLSDGVYLFDANGNMQTGIVDIGGLPFLFDVDGKLVVAQ
jgi:glucan-binding YG repeat protein